eukprot:GHRR01002411.1.p1 GENE.GHRR01002411.1~~GHRR01002411.1.p1  ORF type:complete len:284 (+),score=47.75 GHRR01002411.1:52-903(+)
MCKILQALCFLLPPSDHLHRYSLVIAGLHGTICFPPIGRMSRPMALNTGMQAGRSAARAHCKPFTSHSQHAVPKAVVKEEVSTSEVSISKPVYRKNRLTTAEWRSKYEKDGRVDLFLQDDFNAGAQIVDGQVVYPEFGIGTGEGKSAGNCPSHKVRIINHYTDEEIEVEVPQDRYILWEAEEQGFELPWACRMGCCTACAVKVKEGEVYQPQALGVSEELKQQGYALMCVSFPVGDCVLETVPDDEVYDLQFGRYFAQQALNPNNPESIERDDFAIEIAMGDE